VILDRSPLKYPLQWTLLPIPMSASPLDAFREEVITDSGAVKVVWLSYGNSPTTTHDFLYPTI